MVTLPASLTPLLRRRLERIARAVELGTSRAEFETMMGMTQQQMASTMFRLFGASTWPPVIDPKLWTLPIETAAPPTNGGRKKDERVKDYEAIAARAKADQERIRRERERWLEIEQQKYGLKRRGKHIDDMPA